MRKKTRKRGKNKAEDEKDVKVLRKAYREEGAPESFGGIRALTRVWRGRLRERRSEREERVVKALRGEPSYTLHKPVRYKFPRRKIVVGGAHHQWQADLVDVASYASSNDGSRYLLCVIDVFSKFAWVRAIKSKRGEQVAEAFRDVLDEAGASPLSLQTDKGGEFRSHHFRDVVEEHAIKHFVTENDDIKASVVERFQLTLQRKMHRYFTAAKSRVYGDVLQELVLSYNTSRHSAIGMTPTAALDPTKSERVWLNLYEREPSRKKRNARTKPPRLKVGDHVRISKSRRVFQRGYLPYWTEEIFTVSSVLYRTTPVTYGLKDYAGESVEGTFYEQELQRVDPPDYYDVEEILDTRKRRGVTEYLVKWRGYPESFNSWERDLIKNETKRS